MGVPGPSNLFVFLDEHPNSINDAAFAVRCDLRGASATMIDWPASSTMVQVDLRLVTVMLRLKSGWTSAPLYHTKILAECPTLQEG